MNIVPVEGCAQTEELGELFKALAAAQADIEFAEKDSQNPHFKSNYANLASVYRACKAALSKQSLSVAQMLSTRDGNAGCYTILGHSSGQWMRGWLEARPLKPDVQGFGSAFTYLRRYALAAMVGVAPDEDDDGNEASGSQKKLSERKKDETPHAETPHTGKDWDARVDDGDVRRFWADYKAVVPSKFPTEADFKKWVVSQVGDIRKCRKKDLKKMRDLLAALPTANQTDKASIQRRWAVCVKKSGLSIEEASWWAEVRFGWILDDAKGRASATLTPFEDVRKAVVKLESAQPADIDTIKNGYALMLDEKNRP